VEEALETAVLLDDVDAIGICVSYGADPRRIVEIFEARAAEEADRERTGLGDEHGNEIEEDGMGEEET
jgi:methylmalonyl-CoA mutase cobalamin-binding subunit